MSTGWTELAAGIRIRQSRAFAMNSVVLLDREHSVVVDPGVMPSELDDVARVVVEAKPARVTLFFTHAHWDHVLGRPWFPGASAIGHDRLARELKRDRAAILDEARRIVEQHGESWTRGFDAFEPEEAVSGLRFMKLGEWKLVFRDAPGHSASALTLHLPDHQLLIAGDLLSDEEIPLLDGPPAHYRHTLEALLPLVRGGAIETLVPGHGSIARGREAVAARFEHDLAYLAVLEREVGAARAARLTVEQTLEQLATLEYRQARATRVHPHRALGQRHARVAGRLAGVVFQPLDRSVPTNRRSRGRRHGT
ncbi:MAG: MBL fold metallo-hydrolase [Candidatus Eisenbacteria bacterium]|uniref:MBL fold metallo-hydrolase n=1 Tax=Eiseniibacteriota bacterium TaxID=2212470 RepID=A0A849SRY7_UNCEI|nr:MBL fold metallo-hydrolase [Candidatus Eisenbacteria bacterium]